jgi:hypothetical protein
VQEDDTSELLYHIRLVSLLAKCTEGSNVHTVIRCRVGTPHLVPSASPGYWCQSFTACFFLRTSL